MAERASAKTKKKGEKKMMQECTRERSDKLHTSIK